MLTRVIDARPEAVYRAWTEPALLSQWFAPRPWTTPHVEVDVRPGGRNLFVMRSPEGEDFPNVGVYLAVEPNRRIVVTDAFSEAWVPAAKPFMTLEVTLDDLGGGQTRYTARVLHPTVADRKRHEAMGFHAGWGQCADQLAEVAAKLR